MKLTNTFMVDMMHVMQSYFHKILRVNLTTEEFELIWSCDNSDWNYCEKGKIKISDWLNWFPVSGMVHVDDIIDFTRFSNIDNLRNKMKEHIDRVTFRYRRRNNNGTYSWTLMELIPSIDYDENNQIVIMYIRDINMDYSKDYEYRCMLERIGLKDDLTGIQNRYKYDRAISSLKKFKPDNVGVLFADLNGLKYVNDKQGHVAGDNLIIKFANMLMGVFDEKHCYRISGDEFVVIIRDVNFEKFKKLCKRLDKAIGKLEVPIASTGYIYSEEYDITKALREAEQLMYIRKNIFYEKFPELKR